MESTCFIDIHTHTQHPGVTAAVAYMIGSGEPFPKAEFVSAGVHPWDAEYVDMAEATDFLGTADIAAIGEIGLDFSHNVDKAKQERVFRMQLEIAARRNLPVILHCVKAYNEVLQILQQYDLKAVIFHGYTGSPEQTKTIIDRGYYISIGDRSLRSDKTVESIRNTPLSSIFAETDTSDTPIGAIYDTIADIKQVEVTRLKIMIFNNFKKVIG